MKRLIFLAMMLTVASAIAAPPPAYRITIERQSIGDAPQLKAFEASAFTLRAQYTDSGTPIVLGAGDVPFAYWAWSSRAPAIVTSTYAIVSAASGTVDFTWSAGNMNTNGVGIYGMGITDSNGALTVVKHGTLVLTADPYAGGADPVTFSTTVNWSAYTWIGVPDYVQTISVTTGTTWGASITTGHLSLVVSTNATGELDPVWLSEKGDYLTTAAAALAYATTGSVAAKVDSSTFASTNSGLQAQIDGLVASAGWTQAVIQGETAFIASSNTARQLYLTISGISAKADSNIVWSTFTKLTDFSTFTGATAVALAGKLDTNTYAISATVTDRVSLVSYNANRATDTNRIAIAETNLQARVQSNVWLAARATDTAAVAAVSAGIATADYATNYQNRVQQGTNNTAMHARISNVETGKANLTGASFSGTVLSTQGVFNKVWVGASLDFVAGDGYILTEGATAIVVKTRSLLGNWTGSNIPTRVEFAYSTNDLWRGITNRAPYAEYKSTSNEVATLNTAAVLRAGGVAYGTHTFGQLIVTNSLIVSATNSGLGAELVTDGTFSASPLPWTLVACYTNNGQLVTDAGLTGTFAPSSTVSAVAGSSYQVAFSNTTTGAGTITLVFGGVTNSITLPCEQKTVMVVARTTEGFSGSVQATALCAIDGVSIKRIGRGSGSVAGDLSVGSNLIAGVSVSAPNITAMVNTQATERAERIAADTNFVSKTGPQSMTGPLYLFSDDTCYLSADDHLGNDCGLYYTGNVAIAAQNKYRSSFIFAGAIPVSAENNIGIGNDVQNDINDAVTLRGTLYLDGGTGVLYRSTFGSGEWTAIGSGSGATGSIISLTFGGSNYTAGTPSLQIVGGGVSTGYDGSVATFTFPVAATGTPLYAYTETDTQAIARLNIASNGLQSQVTTAQATGVAAHARADVAYTAAAAPNGAAVTNVPGEWLAGGSGSWSNGAAYNVTVLSLSTQAAFYGDSITDGDACSVPTNQNYRTVLATNKIWTAINNSVSGGSIADFFHKLYNRTIASDETSVMLLGYNDMRDRGANATDVEHFRQAALAFVGYAAIPSAKLITGQSASVTNTGTWTASTNYGGAMSLKSSDTGAALYFRARGPTIYLSVERSRAVSVTVDGTNAGTYMAEAYTPPYSGTNTVPQLIRLGGLSETWHNMAIAVAGTSGTAQFNWAASPRSAMTEIGPSVFVGNCLEMTATGYTVVSTNGSDAAAALYNAALSDAVRILAGDGLNVAYVDVCSRFDADTMTCADHVHPNQLGYATIAESFRAEMNAASRFSGRGLDSGGAGRFDSIRLGTNAAISEWSELPFESGGGTSDTNTWTVGAVLQQDAGATCWVRRGASTYRIIATNSPTTIAADISGTDTWSLVSVEVAAGTNNIAFGAGFDSEGGGAWTNVISSAYYTLLLHRPAYATNRFGVWQLP